MFMSRDYWGLGGSWGPRANLGTDKQQEQVVKAFQKELDGLFPKLYLIKDCRGKEQYSLFMGAIAYGKNGVQERARLTGKNPIKIATIDAYRPKADEDCVIRIRTNPKFQTLMPSRRIVNAKISSKLPKQVYGAAVKFGEDAAKKISEERKICCTFSGLVRRVS